MDIELGEIRTFVAVAEAGSINRAAHELNMSQPAVTRHVQRLEAALGAQLLDRRARPVVPTPLGLRVLERCRQVVKAVRELRGVAAAEVGPSGECRLGVAHALAELALTGPVDHLRKSFPNVTVRIDTAWSGPLVDQVRSGGLDAAVVQLPRGDHPPAGLEGRVLGTEVLVFVASRRHRLPTTADLTDLAKATWVLNPEGCGFRAALGRALRRVDAPLHVAVEAHGAELQLSLVSRDLGLGLVPARAFMNSPLRSQLKTFQVRGHEFRLAIWALRGQPLTILLPVLAAFETELTRMFEARAGRDRVHGQLRADSHGRARASTSASPSALHAAGE